tara:strand:+ start:191 stop:802 length:612 start_codon:yes stop_codon:yes gene_type:complete
MKRDQLKEYFRRQYRLLTEQEEEEDPFATDDEGGDEEAEEDEGGDDATEDDAGGEEEAKEDKPEVDLADEQRFQKSIDDQLQALLIDIEADAIKSAIVQKESKSLKTLFINEASGVAIDTDKFASEVARLILNFDAFLDLEQTLLSKVNSFLIDKHGEDVAQEVMNIVSARHDISFKSEKKELEDEVEEQVPIAVGAIGGTGA